MDSRGDDFRVTAIGGPIVLALAWATFKLWEIFS